MGKARRTWLGCWRCCTSLLYCCRKPGLIPAVRSVIGYHMACLPDGHRQLLSLGLVDRQRYSLSTADEGQVRVLLHLLEQAVRWALPLSRPRRVSAPDDLYGHVVYQYIGTNAPDLQRFG